MAATAIPRVPHLRLPRDFPLVLMWFHDRKLSLDQTSRLPDTVVSTVRWWVVIGRALPLPRGQCVVRRSENQLKFEYRYLRVPVGFSALLVVVWIGLALVLPFMGVSNPFTETGVIPVWFGFVIGTLAVVGLLMLPPGTTEGDGPTPMFARPSVHTWKGAFTRHDIERYEADEQRVAVFFTPNAPLPQPGKPRQALFIPQEPATPDDLTELFDWNVTNSPTHQFSREDVEARQAEAEQSPTPSE